MQVIEKRHKKHMAAVLSQARAAASKAKPKGVLQQRAVYCGLGKHINWRYLGNRAGADAISETGNNT